VISQLRPKNEAKLVTNNRTQQLGQLFESQRDHLRAVAYRMLGSATEAEDAVQETWLRLNRSDAGAIENLGGWLTTVVARVCLDMLRSRESRREESLESQLTEPVAGRSRASDPEQEVILADSVGVALLVMLDTLTPAERLAFVMHDMFDVSFDEIASIIGRSPSAARQLASRARRRVRGADRVQRVGLNRERKVINAFLAALRAGDLEGLLAVLDPDVVFRSDIPGAPAEVRGTRDWAQGAIAFSQLARFVQPALVNGSIGSVFAPRGRLLRVLTFEIVGEKIVGADVITNPERLQQLELSPLTE
jgi:RNA polymerase sigma-70 factor, ECF subfamily